MKEVLTGPEIMTLHAIAADLKQANRSLTAVKIPGQSNTAQDMAALAKGGHAQSWLSRMLSPGGLAGAGAAAGSMVGGGFGAAVGGGVGAHYGQVIQAMRQAGLNSVDEIIRDALLNPERARALLAKVGAEPTRQEAINLAQVYMRAVLGQTVSAPMGSLFGIEPPPASAPALRPAADRRSELDRLSPSLRTIAELMLDRGIPIQTYSPAVQKVARALASRNGRVVT